MKKLAISNLISIVVELFGILIMSGGLVAEYYYGGDIFLLFVSIGSLIFSIGSGFVKKFPWAYLRGGIDGGKK